MGRSIDDAADIQGKGVVKRLPFPAVEKPQVAAASTTPTKVNASDHRFCRYSDGSEGAVVRGLTFKGQTL